MIESSDWSNAFREEAIHQTIIKRQPGRIHRPNTFWQDARPGDGKAIGRQTEVGHELDILLDAMVVINGDITGLALIGMSRRGREAVPNGGTTPIFARRAFDLVGGGRRAPQELSRKAHSRHLTCHDSRLDVSLRRSG